MGADGKLFLPMGLITEGLLKKNINGRGFITVCFLRRSSEHLFSEQFSVTKSIGASDLFRRQTRLEREPNFWRYAMIKMQTFEDHVGIQLLLFFENHPADPTNN
ncbi:unnamed protein product [Nesidiocoris tenuis]|uniref:Uncharacterized protein n=1 Tax=Nesidiocoris tenuis TaxID=355587 RepID=A0A6H5HRA9_9HEMI|nr:unnamed protein product [Nesidiocoris tenuis]